MKRINSKQSATKLVKIVLLCLLLVTGCRSSSSTNQEQAETQPLNTSANTTAQSSNQNGEQKQATPIATLSPTSIGQEQPSPIDITSIPIPTTSTTSDELTLNDEAELSDKDSDFLIRLDQPTGIFSISDSHHSTPADVFRELEYSGGFGGGGFDPCAGTSPGVLQSWEDELELEWMETLLYDTTIVCGWQFYETVQVTLISPDGTLLVDETTEAAPSFDGYSGAVSFEFETPINTLPGEYQYRFVGQSGTVNVPIIVKLPEEPRLYRQDKLVILYNFQPGETVRLFAYQRDENQSGSLFFFSMGGYGSLVGWHEFQVNESGQAVIELVDDTVEGYWYVAVGDISGEVTKYPWEPFDPFTGIVVTTPVQPIRPTFAELDSAPNLWELAQYQDLKSPGIQQYRVTVETGDRWLWGFSWCAIDEVTLLEIVQPLSLEFYIGEILGQISVLVVEKTPLEGQHILEYSEVLPNGWHCYVWRIFLDNWPVNETVILGIIYTLDSEIYDGLTSYPAGTYEQVMGVEFQP